MRGCQLSLAEREVLALQALCRHLCSPVASGVATEYQSLQVAQGGTVRVYQSGAADMPSIMQLAPCSLVLTSIRPEMSVPKIIL